MISSQTTAAYIFVQLTVQDLMKYFNEETKVYLFTDSFLRVIDSD